MKLILKKNRIIISALAIMIAIAGYLNITKDTVLNESEKLANEVNSTLGYDVFAYEPFDSLEFADISDEDSLIQEDELSVLDASIISDKTVTEAAQNGEKSDLIGEAVLASVSIGNGYFSTAKLTREQIRAKNTEMLMNIVADGSISEEQKQAAIDSIVLMTDVAAMENSAEMLLEAKGFLDVVVSIIDNSVDVVVNATGITEQQIAQIEDIIMRKTGVSAENIVIAPVVMEE